MRTTALWSLSATELAAGYLAGEFSPDDALEAVLERLDAVNPLINAVISVDRNGAHTAAAQSSARWRAGAPLSALDGIPVTIKDNLFVRGLPATWGSLAHQTFVPDVDEPAVARLRGAGLVILGKTNVPEFTLQGYTDNLVFGTTRNPHARERTPGGSSGGAAAAVAAGIAPIAIGTDGGGSLRRPAAHCGLFAFKPSIGQIARHGGFPAILADFEVIGPIARHPNDLAAVFDLLRGFDARDPRSLSANAPWVEFPTPLRVGYFRQIGTAPVDPAISAAADAFADALERDGCAVRSIESPFDLSATGTAWSNVAAVGLAWYLDKHPEIVGRVGANAAATAAAGRSKSTTDYVDGLAFAAQSRIDAAALFETFDLLLCPATAALAWPAGEAFPAMIDGQRVGPRGHAIFTAWMNVAGLPVVTVPVAMTREDGGIGMQLVAASGQDRTLLNFLRNAPAIRALGTAGLTEGLLQS